MPPHFGIQPFHYTSQRNNQFTNRIRRNIRCSYVNFVIIHAESNRKATVLRHTKYKFHVQSILFLTGSADRVSVCI